jgi:hypothetical protein
MASHKTIVIYDGRPNNSDAYSITNGEWELADGEDYYTRDVVEVCTYCNRTFEYQEKWYIVKYIDGVDNETVFEDQISEIIVEDELTPTFNGIIPTRKGYIFKGWDKTVSEKVNGNVTYIALWEKQDGSLDYDNPLTGDNIIFYVSVLGLSVIVLAGALICIKKKR